MARPKQRLSKSEAEELTRSLGQLAGAATDIIDQYVNVLEVPKSMGMEPDEWVQEHLGGYARRSRDQLRDEVRQMDSMYDEEGNPVKRTAQQIGDVLGLATSTVDRYRAEIKAENKRALKAGASTSEEVAEHAETRASTSVEEKLSPDDRREQVAKGIGEGKSDGDMALEFGVSVGTIAKDRKLIKDEKLTTTLPGKTGDTASRKIPQAVENAKLDQLPTEIMSLAGRLRIELDKVPGWLDLLGKVEDEDLGNLGDHMQRVLTEQKDQTDQAFDDALGITDEALKQLLT